MNRTATPTRTHPRFSRTGMPARVAGRRRQPAKKSAPQRVIKSVTGALPGLGRSAGRGKASKKSRGRGGKAGGIALVSAAAGMAFKNRGKLTSMFNRGPSNTPPTGTTTPAETSAAEAGTRPIAGAADPARRGNLAPTDPGNRPDIPAAG